MNELPLTRDQVRLVDKHAIEEFGMPGVILMENASRGTADWLVELRTDDRPVLIVCGKGNNGGDGFAIARHLDNRGIPVEVLLFAEPESIHGDAAINLYILKQMSVPLLVLPEPAVVQERFAAAGWVVDALLGTGMTSAPHEPFANVIRAINQRGGYVLAVDVPSGLDCNTGTPYEPTVRASHTATFVAPKVGFAQARAWTGEVRVIDIGVPRQVIEGVRHGGTGVSG